MKKSLLVLFLVLITLGAILALWKQDHAGGLFFSRERLPERLFRFRVEEIRKVIVSWQKEKVTLFLDKDKLWRLKERDSALASASRINGILASLSTLAPLKRIQDTSPEILRELSLREKAGKDPKDKTPPGILVRLLGEGDKEMGRLILGTGHFPPLKSGTREHRQPKARYVRSADGNIYLVSKVFEELLPIPMAYIEPFAIRGMEKLLMLAVYDLSGKREGGRLLWCVGRQGTSQAFRTIYPRDRKLSQKSLTALVKHFSRQMTLDLASEKLPLKGERRILIRLSDGLGYELELFKKGIHLYMRIQLSFQEKGVLPYPGESKENYRKRVESLKERYHYEKQYFHNKTFFVRPDISNDLLKDPFPQPPRKEVRKKGGSSK